MNIAQVFFNHMGYPEEIENILLPYIVRSFVILEDMFKKDATLLSICQCRLRFISFLKEKGSEDMTRRGMGAVVSKLGTLEVKIQEKINDIPGILAENPSFEDFFFAFGSDDAGIKFSDENQIRYMNGELKIIHIIESQPEIIFRV